MDCKTIFLVWVFLANFSVCLAQTDSSALGVQDIPARYYSQINNKVDKYSTRITRKTEKTLVRLSKWESKIQKALEKSSPETAAKLFAPGQPTFLSMLGKIRSGTAVLENYKKQSDDYWRKLNNHIAFILAQKKQLDSGLIQKIKQTENNLQNLDHEMSESDAISALIKERKKQLLDISITHLSKSKYVRKISKESYYYVETLKNYKELFSDTKKAEQTAVALLKKIPVFKEFLNNANEGSMFRNNGIDNSLTGDPDLAAMGFQTNAMVSQEIQRTGRGGNVTEILGSNADVNDPLQELKNKFPSATGTDEKPDFKPNEMKSKLFKQRLEFGTNLQFGKAVNFLPGSANIGLQAGYKLNDNSTIGIGTSYIIGMGTGIKDIRIRLNGIGLRSFIDWKLKGSFYINGGFEMTYNKTFQSLRGLPSFQSREIKLWKPLALIGVSKKIKMATVKSTFCLLYDILFHHQQPVSNKIIFRIGYTF